MIVLRIRGQIVPCCVVYVHNDTHTHEQFLKVCVGSGLGLVFVRLFRFNNFVFSGLA